MANDSRTSAAATIGVVASLIGIFTFVTGKDHLSDARAPGLGEGRTAPQVSAPTAPASEPAQDGPSAGVAPPNQPINVAGLKRNLAAVRAMI